MKKLSIALWLAQVLAAIAMLIAAAIQVESILVTGPILTVVGLLLALVSRPLQMWTELMFALSGPLVSAFISFLIALFSWGPAESDTQVVVILSAYLLFGLPAAALSLRPILHWEILVPDVAPPVFQFSLKSLLILMTAVCLLIAALKFLLNIVGRDESFLFGGFTLVVIVLCGVVVWRFVAY